MFNVGDKTQMRLVILHLLARASRPLANNEITSLLGLPLHKVNRQLYSLTTERPPLIEFDDGAYRFTGNKSFLSPISIELSEYIGGLKLDDGASFDSDFQQDDYIDESEMIVTDLSEEKEASNQNPNDWQDKTVSIEPHQGKNEHDNPVISSEIAETENELNDANPGGKEEWLHQNDLNLRKEFEMTTSNQENSEMISLSEKEYRLLKVLAAGSAPVMEQQILSETELSKEDLKDASEKLAELGFVIISVMPTFNENIYKASPQAKEALGKVVVNKSNDAVKKSITESNKTQSVDPEQTIASIIIALITASEEIDEDRLIELISNSHPQFDIDQIEDAINELYADETIRLIPNEDAMIYAINYSKRASPVAPTAAPAAAPAAAQEEAMANSQEGQQKQPAKKASDNKKPKDAAISSTSTNDFSPQQISSEIQKRLEQLKSMNLTPNFQNHADIKTSLDSVSAYIKILEDENQKWRKFANTLGEGLKKAFD